MSIFNGRKINPSSRKLIGEILLETGLISPAQLKNALMLQHKSSQIRLGEIVASKGWLKQETIDFLVDVCSSSYELEFTIGQPIGYYFQKAGLLSPEQIEKIIQEQKKLGLKFCYLAVIKGFIKAETAEFFLNNVVDKVSVSPLQAKLNLNYQDDRVDTYILLDSNFFEEDNNYYEEILKTQYIETDDNDSDSILDINMIDDTEIESSPMWIDQ